MKLCHVIRHLSCTYTESVSPRFPPTRKKVTSDDAVTCRNIAGSPSDVGSKVITKIVRAEEGEPGDEASSTSPSSYTYVTLNSFQPQHGLSHSWSNPIEEAFSKVKATPRAMDKEFGG